MKFIRIIVPGKPIAKGRPRMTTINGHARAFTPQRTVNYESLVALAGEMAMEGRPPLEGPLAIVVFAHFALPLKVSKARRQKAADGKDWHSCRPDGDNVLKAAGDGLNGIVWRDDSQIASAQIIKIYSEIPRLVVEVRELCA